MRLLCWVSNATRTHARPRAHREICNTVFPRCQWFRERASMLRCKYIFCRVLISFCNCIIPWVRGCEDTNLILAVRVQYLLPYCGMGEVCYLIRYAV